VGSTNQPPPPDGPAGDLRAELRAELAALTRGFAAQVAWRRRGGSYAAAGAPSPRLAGPEPVALTPVAAGSADEWADQRAGARRTRAGARRRGGGVAPRTLPMIRADLGDCQRCKLCTTRDQIVFGVGPALAPIMFIGEAPGAEEDRRGVPFVGPAGELLDKMIEAMGWGRDDVYIANVVKCRPPGNRNPEPDEVAACRPFLDAQLQAVRPRVIVTLGKPAAQVVLRDDAPISALRGRWHEHRGVKVMPTFHPAFLLRQPDRKRDTWSDLKQVIAELARVGVAPPRPARG
jgi:uracil-DNA glycosylase family 4